MVLYEAPIFTDDHTQAACRRDYVQRMDQLVAKGDNAGAIKHFMQNGMQVPWFGVFMMQTHGHVQEDGARRTHPAL